MDPELQQRFTVLEQKVDAAYKSSEKVRKYFKWTLIITLAVTILPLIGLLFIIPKFISAFTSSYAGLLQ